MEAPPLVHEPKTSLCDPEIVICGDGLNLSRTEYAMWLDHIHSAPLHIITVSSIGREFSTASLLLNWRREMELMAIMNHLSCLFSAFPLNYSARRTLLAQYGYTNTALCTAVQTLHYVQLYKHCAVYGCTNTALCTAIQTLHYVQLYKHCTVYSYKNTALCTAIQTLRCVRLYKHCTVYSYTNTALCTAIQTLHCVQL